jgi:hypothetical protein
LLQRLESLEAILNPLQKGVKVDQTVQWTTNHQELEWTPERHPHEFQKAHVDVNEEEFELHLLRVGLQYGPPATNYRLSLLFGEEHLYHQKVIHPSLRMALCAHGIFYSNHPYLDSLLRRNEGTAPRTMVVKTYLTQAEKMLPVEPQIEFELIDSIRAMLVIVEGYVSLGDRDDALRINRMFF